MSNQSATTRDPAFEKALADVTALVETFQRHPHDWSEAQARKDFIDKFWIALGWDVNHERQTNPYEQEVKVERDVSVSGRARRADYAFLAPNFRDVRFFVEAKRPGAAINTPDDCFQVVRYGWNSHVPLSVLTDFQNFIVLDCRFRPDIDTATHRVISDLQFHCTEYPNPEVFAKIYYLFGREAVANGSLERYAETLPRPKGKAAQRGLFAAGRAKSIDESFLEELEQFRDELARSLKRTNHRVDSEELTEVTQRTLDRLVFMRFLEDKLIESDPIVESFGTRGTAWQDFIAASRRLDRVYNGIIFKEHSLLDAPSFKVDDDVFAGIRDRLAHTNSPYVFSYIPIHILGSIYERFLGNTIVATAKQARVEPKPEVRKAGGVYYTPEYIVRYIVENTVGKLTAGKSPEEIADLRFADIACGSGSFLLGVYDTLLRRVTAYYNESTRKRASGRRAGCVEGQDAKLHLSLKQKREILVRNVYGVDLDPQAVEVAQLSLYLKLLEEETVGSVRHYQLEFHEQLLPDLKSNIVCGNSLIGWDILDGKLFDTHEEKKFNPMDFRDVFPDVIRNGGFDAIVGNPPYIQLSMEEFRNPTVNAYLKRTYGFSGGRLNTFAFFIDRARTFAREGGSVGYIVPNTFITQEYYEFLRRTVLQQTDVITVASVAEAAFREAVVENVIVIFSKHSRPPDQVARNTIRFEDLAPSGVPLFRASASQATIAQNYRASFIAPENPLSARLAQRLKAAKVRFGDCLHINQAIALKHDRAACLSDTKKNRDYHEVLDGRHIERYYTGRSPNYFKFDLSKIHSCKREDIFLLDEKIFFRRVGKGLVGTLDSQRKYALNTLVVVSPTSDCQLNLRFVLGLFNSSFLSFLYLQFLKSSKKVFSEIQARQVEQLPLPFRSPANQREANQHDRLVTFVDEMIAAKKNLVGARTDRDRQHFERKCVALDRQIDQLVYELYGLTPEEIALVEDRQSAARA